MIRVLIDGKAIEVSEGTSALTALRAAGLDVPTGCHDPRLHPTGGCRLCLVRLKGTNRPVTACALSVLDGMEIEVDAPDLLETRREELALLAKSYPVDAVSQAPEKTFNRWLIAYGLLGEGSGVQGPTTDSGRNPSPPGPLSPDSGRGGVDESNPYFRFDPEACIKCFNCVRVCEEVQGANVWQIMDRSSQTHVIPDSMGLIIDSSCVSCGACVDVCPTSALVDKSRLLHGMPEKWTKTTCPYCGVGCEMHVGTIGNQIVQVRPVMDAPVNKGHLCVKGRYAHQFVHAPDRVTTPMIRREGVWSEASWDEAISHVATELARVKEKHGANAIGVLGSARAPNEDNYLAQKFARVVLGTNNVDCCARVCHGPTAAAMKVMLGTGAATNSYNDLELAKTLMIVGANATENHPIVGERIRQARKRGAKIIVIDPRRIPLAAEAEVHLQLKPGTNVPLLNAMAHVILNEGLADEGFLSTRTNEAEAFREFVKEWTPERAAEICGVRAEDIRRAARLYATNKPSMCFHGLGVTEHTQGTEGVMCLTNLALLTGNIGRPGAGINPLRGQNNVQGSAHMGCEPSNLTGFVSIADGKERFQNVWNADIPDFPGLNLMQMLEAADKGTFKAMWAIGYDVYFTNASAERTRHQFEQMEFVVVQDLFMNETAREFADVFLPACSSFERDGTFMNAERRVQRVRPAIEPVGDNKPDWEIVQLVAQAMGADHGFSFESAEAVWEEVRKVWTPGGGMSYARLENEGLQWPCPTEDHPGTTILHSKSFPIGDRALLKRIDYTPTPEVTSPEFPFILTTGRTLYQFNAATMTGRTFNQKLRPMDTLDIHPDDAADIGISTGDRVRVASHYGEAFLPARLDRRLRRGTVFATFHSREVFLNLITSKEKDKVVGSPEYKLTAVALSLAPECATTSS